MLAFLFVIANVCMWNTFFWFGGPALVVSSSPLQCGEADRPALSLGTQIENIFLRQVHDVATFAAWAITHSQYNTSYIKIHQVIIYIYIYKYFPLCSSKQFVVCFSSMLRPAEEAMRKETCKNHQWRDSCKCWMHSEKSDRCRLPKHSKRPWNLAMCKT